MKDAIRMFALVVAFAGLASASIAPATTQVVASRAQAKASGPGPTISLPAPLPCQSNGSCVAAPTQTR